MAGAGVRLERLVSTKCHNAVERDIRNSALQPDAVAEHVEQKPAESDSKQIEDPWSQVGASILTGMLQGPSGSITRETYIKAKELNKFLQEHPWMAENGRKRNGSSSGGDKPVGEMPVAG
ncbi:hypothetical protein MUP56_03030 [Patescibacteria group bacterium]|nr:hypothetical protein [Patescibacteria group bacterium]